MESRRFRSFLSNRQNLYSLVFEETVLYTACFFSANYTPSQPVKMPKSRSSLCCSKKEDSSSSSEGSSYESRGPREVRFPVTTGLQSGRMPQNPRQESRDLDQPARNPRSRYSTSSSQDRSSRRQIYQEYMDRVPPFGSAGSVPLNQLPHIIYADSFRRTDPIAYRNLVADSARPPPLNFFRQQPPPYTPTAYQSTQREGEEISEPARYTHVNPESYNFIVRATSRRNEDASEDEDEDSGIPLQAQTQPANITIGRTGAPSISRPHHRTSLAEVGNMNRTFIQGFDAPTGSRRIANLADDDD